MKRIAHVLLLSVLSSAALASPFAPAFKLEDLDLENCRSWKNDQSEKADPTVLKHVLGFEWQQERHLQRWVGPAERDEKGHYERVEVPKGQEPPKFFFQLAFRQPVEIGTVLAHSSDLKLLNAETAYPGNPMSDDGWEAVPSWPNQTGIRSFVFPPGRKVRSVVCSIRLDWRQQVPAVDTWKFYRSRLLNICPTGHANASEEYVPPPPHLGPRAPKRAAKGLTAGRGPHWENTGTDRDGMVRRPPIDKLNPVWVMLSWREPYDIVGLLPMGDCGGFELSYFDGPDLIPPKAGTRREWRKLPHTVAHGGILEFGKPVTTRGIRINITKGGREAPIASLYGMHAYVDLGNRPLPAFEKREELASPLRIEYEMPHDGLVSMIIEDAKGGRARNLFALNERTKGKHELEWDGKDLDDRYVLPGQYTWRALTSEPLQLHYQFTAYPNITKNTPWQTGHHGPGGWMADHTPPMAACTYGDRVWLGSPCAESGVSFIECDLEGNKLTGWHSFEAWTGPKFLCTDGKTVFISHPKENDDPVWGYDIEKRSVRTVLRQAATETRRTGICGMAVRDGKLYLSVRSPVSWVVKPFGSPNVDLDGCFPRYRPPRKPRKPHEVVPNPQRDTLRLFRLEGSPPGQNVGLTYLETEDEAGRRHHIVLGLKRPQAIGSAVFPVPQNQDQVKFYLSVLKPDGKYPPDPKDKSQWIVLEDSGKTEWDVVALPPGTITRAVRLTFEKAGGDPLADVEEDFGGGEGGDGLGLETLGVTGKKQSGPKWKGRLDGMTFLRRRYENLLHTAKVRVSSGEYRENGEWWGAPKSPISKAEPGIFVMEWERAVKVRGLAIKEIDGQWSEVDVFTGGPEQAVNLAGDENWRKVAAYKQNRRNFYVPDDNHNSEARYLDGQVDFGEVVETRAVRIRVVESFQPVEGRPWGVRADRGGTQIDPKRVRVYGVAPLGYLGGEVPVDSRQIERISIYDLAKEDFTEEIPVERPDRIAFGPKGDLFALSGGRIVKVDLSTGAKPDGHQVLIDDLESPSAFAIDQQSHFYVYDRGQERQVIRVYDPEGKYLRDIGTPGGRKVGPWDVSRFRNVTSLAVDKDRNLWVVEFAANPKRISKWTSDGKFLKELLGPTQYGGGGVLDPYDKTRLYYRGMEFELDWEKGTSRLKNLLWDGPSAPGEVPIMFQGRKYMVTRDCFGRQEAGIVYLYEGDHLKPVGAVGCGSGFPQLREPAVLGPLGGVSLPEYRFTWSDASGDGQVQPEEVKLTALRKDDKGNAERFGVGLFDRDLGMPGGTLYYQVKEVLPSGAPVWEEKHFPKIANLQAFGTQYYRLPDGNFFHFGSHHAVLTPEGKVLWKWRTAGVGGHALMSAPSYYPGQACAEFADICHPACEDAPEQGELGAFRVHHSNPGAWNIWTHDGFFAGYLFRDQRHPGTPGWNMAEHQRGLRLDRHQPGQEHFQGYFCRTNDGKYYMVAGHNHASIIEVKGLETFKRLNGTIAVTADLLQQLKDWEIAQESEEVFGRAPVYDLYRFKTPPKIDAEGKDWDAMPAAAIMPSDPDDAPIATFKMGYDDTNLYLYYSVRYGPLKNSGRDWRALFKTGASVDLQMSVSPEAPDDRKAPVEGDLRLLITYINEREPVACLYRPVAPGAPAESAYEVVSPVFHIKFDEVRRLEGFEIARSGDGQYELEAAIPLSELGLKPVLGQRYRLDWGVLTTDDYGNACTGRLYWSNKATGILADAPSEALMMPHLWGHIRVGKFRKGGPADLESLSSFSDQEGEEVDMIDIEKEFDD